MQIKVATRFRPFSHKPGAFCLVPGQEAVLQAFPVFSEVKTLTGKLIFKEPGRETLFQDLEKPYRPERLSFGNHKQQDVDKIRSRQDLSEILPIWWKLSTYYPSKGEPKPGSLLYDLIHETDRNALCDRFLKLYLAGMTPFFVPRSKDEEHHGFDKPPILPDEDPFLILTEGAKAIEQMIVKEEAGMIHVLPHLPSEFHCGRLIDLPLPSGKISIEWTKHFLRRVIFTPYQAGEGEIKFPTDVKQYRVKAKGTSFCFDNFQA